MAFKVVWTCQGDASLEEIYDGLAGIDADAADRLLAGIFDTTDVLKRFPYIGPAGSHEGGKRHTARYSTNGIGSSIAWIGRDRRYIMRVWHSSRDEPTFSE
jgi:plasmid stabilization system protein ParE